MNRHWLSIIALIGLTLLFITLWESPPERFRRDQATPEQPPQIATSILHDAKNNSFDANGLLSYTFKAVETRHYQTDPDQQSDRDYSDFTAPYMVMFHDPKHPWYIQSKQGRATENGQLIELWGDVIAWQIDANGDRSELTTSYLRLRPEQQYAETDKPVMIDTAGSKTNAVGMKAFLQQDRIELLSRVRGIHEPI